MAKKSKKLKAPKRIGGVKVPKRLRRNINDVLASDLGREVLAEVIVTAGAALIGSQAKRDSPTRRFMREHAPGGQPGDVANARSVLAVAIGEASRSFAEALHRSSEEEEDARAAAWSPQTDAGLAEAAVPPKKPTAGRDPSPTP